MIGMKISLIMGMLALPAAVIIILIVCVVGEIQSDRQAKRFETALRQCESVRGWEFTSHLLNRCSENNIPVCDQTELLEYFTDTARRNVCV